MTPTQGTLTTWKQDKGFGFISPLGGGVDVFVHIRDFGHLQRLPMVGDSVTYQPMKGKDGRYRAADVRIAGVPRDTRSTRVPQNHRPSQHTPRRESGRTFPSRRISIVLTIALIAFGYSKLQPSHNQSAAPEPRPMQQTVTESAFSCEGKRYCSEMHSCAEARYYLNACPNTEMDGDNDGVPCESQWCN